MIEAEKIVITDYLPHRYPFLFVDRVKAISDTEITAIKHVSNNESFFQGHFPDDAILPGVIIIEALAQTCGILSFHTHNAKPGDQYKVYLVGVDKARFRHPVRPGDTLTMKAQIAAHKQFIWRFNCQAYVEDKLACSLILTSSVRKKDGS